MTAEFAVLLPGVVLMLAMVVFAAVAGVDQLRCFDAARSAARLAARHEPVTAVLAVARAAAPAGAQVQISQGSGLVRVRVRASVAVPLPGRPALGLEGVSTARLEPGGGSAQAGDTTTRAEGSA